MRNGWLLGSACVIAAGMSFSASANAGAEAAPAPGGAPAAAADVEGIADIVVTAQKRAENLQEVPLAVSAIGSAELERRRVTSVLDLPRVAPGISVGQHAGFARLFIRGIGLTSISNGQDPSVAFQIDGVVIGRPSAQLASFFDVERVEVLRGPQGTLYGRNATGGVVNVITRRPTRENSGYLNLSFGNYNALTAEGAISGPLDSQGDIRARFAFQTNRHDGFGRNVYLNKEIDDQSTWAVRATIEADPSESVRVAVTGDFTRAKDANYAFHAFGPYRADVPIPGLDQGAIMLVDSRDIASRVHISNDRNSWGFGGTIDVDAADHLGIRSITGYRESYRAGINDPAVTSFDAFGPTLTMEKARQFSQELQLNYSGDRLQGTAGLFYFSENVHAQLHVDFPFLGRVFHFQNPDPTYHEYGDLSVKSFAAFTQWTYEVVDDFRLTAGLRYSNEKRHSVGNLTVFTFMPPPNSANIVIPIDQSRTWNAVTPKFGVDYRPAEDVMLYASVTRGFKSGVILIGNPNPPVGPEYVWSYEAGFKTTLLDRRLQLNGSAFYYDYKDLQVNKLVGNSIVTENAASARVKGFELEVTAKPVPQLDLNLAITYLDARFREFETKNPARPELGILNLSGNHLANAPQWAINGGAEVELPVGLPGRLSLRGDVAYSSRQFFTEFNDDRLSQKPVALVDASLQYESSDERWRASLFVKNLTDQKVRSNVFVAAQTTGFAMNGGYKPPRMWGASVGYSF